MKKNQPTAPPGMTVQKSGMGFVVLFKLEDKTRITSRHQYASDAILEAERRIAASKVKA